MIEVITTIEGVQKLAKKLQGVKVLSFDLEFSPLNPHDNSRVFLASLAANGVAYVIDFTLIPPSSMKALEPVLASKQVKKIGHNISIDWKHALHHFGIRLQNVYCTQIAEEVLTAGLEVESVKYIDHDGKERSSSFSLAALLWRRMGITLEKETRNVFINYDGSPFTKEVYDYAGKDTLYLEEIYNQQQKEIEEKNLQRVINLEMRLLPYVAQMEYNGIHFNIDRCKSAIPVVEEIIEKMERWLQDTFIANGIAERILIAKDGYSTVRTSSWQQLLSAFQRMGIDVESTDKNVLKDWDHVHGLRWNNERKEENIWIDDVTEGFDIAYVNAVLRHHAVKAALTKFKGTYLEGLQERYHAPTGKVYPSFRQTGARATGRFSSNNPNFQNMIRSESLKALGLGDYDVRAMFYAPKGHKLIICDLEGIELCLLAIIADDEKLMHVIRSGDAHSPVATIISTSFGCDPVTAENKGIQPYKTFRNTAKTLTYAKMYGSGPKNLHRRLAIPLATVGYDMTFQHAQRWIEQWNAMFPKAAVALESAAQQAVTQGYVETVLGRRRQWDTSKFDDKSKYFGAMREGANSLIQGSAADLMKVALVRMCERLDTKRSWLLAQIHDEALVMATDDYVEEAAEIVGREMVKAGEVLFGEKAKGIIKATPKISSVYDK